MSAAYNPTGEDKIQKKDNEKYMVDAATQTESTLGMDDRKLDNETTQDTKNGTYTSPYTATR